MPEFEDDKSPICIPFILEQLQAHTRRHDGQLAPPFFIGVNGVQGAGKTTLVTSIRKTFSEPPHLLPVAVFSIDDLYLPQEAQANLACSHPHNPLVQHRGQPSTHDLNLGLKLFQALKTQLPNVRIPSYDKSAYNGEGDRRDEKLWEVVNTQDQEKTEVVLFEGWCVGFRSLDPEELVEKWRKAKAAEDQGNGEGRLGKCKLEHVEFINQALQGYDALTNFLDTMIHIDAEDTKYVYGWRKEQEAGLRTEKGMGMTDEQVNDFVNGYYPAYELFTDALRKGIFPNEKLRQLRLIVGDDRRNRAFERWYWRTLNFQNISVPSIRPLTGGTFSQPENLVTPPTFAITPEQPLPPSKQPPPPLSHH